MKEEDDEPVMTRSNRSAFTRSRSLDYIRIVKTIFLEESSGSSDKKKMTESSSSSGMKKETEISSSSGMKKEPELIHGGGSFKASGHMNLRALRGVQQEQARVRAASI